MTHSRHFVVFATGALLSLGSCNQAQMPGTALGDFATTGHIATNSCGTTLGAPDPYTFTVQLSKDGTTLYWKYKDESNYVSGVLDSSNQATITTSQTSNVDGTDAGAGPCTMARTDSAVVKLDSATSPAAFTGSLTYSFAAASGADCSDQLTSAGGTYQTLPCTISYTLTATKN
jgi:hypothetical protein